MSTLDASRRDFLKRSAVAAAAVGSLSIARSAHAAAGGPLKVALIGCGGRGTGAASDMLSVVGDDVKIVAVADAFKDRAQGAVNHLKKNFAAKTDIADDCIFIGLDAFHKAIACADMVILATPPGFRPTQYKAAVEAGKHVFMEKPCCTDAPGFRMLMAANKLADEKGLKVGVGLQRRHDSGYQGGVKEIQDGQVGDFIMSRVYWNGDGIWFRDRQPDMTEMQFQVRNWYHFVWLSGDNICEQHVHNLDVGNWVKGDHPVEANGMGSCLQRYKGRDPKKGMGQIFDNHFVEFTYKDGTKMYSQCRHIPNTWGGVRRNDPRRQGHYRPGRPRSQTEVRQPVPAGTLRPAGGDPQQREVQRGLVRRHQQLYRRAGPHGDLLRQGGEVGRGRGQGAG